MAGRRAIVIGGTLDDGPTRRHAPCSVSHRCLTEPARAPRGWCAVNRRNAMAVRSPRRRHDTAGAIRPRLRSDRCGPRRRPRGNAETRTEWRPGPPRRLPAPRLPLPGVELRRARRTPHRDDALVIERVAHIEIDPRSAPPGTEGPSHEEVNEHCGRRPSRRDRGVREPRIATGGPHQPAHSRAATHPRPPRRGAGSPTAAASGLGSR